MASELVGKNVRSFIIKSIQCIVEARLGGLPVSTIGKPNKSEWFNIALNEFQEVNLMTKRCLENLMSDCREDLPVNYFLIKNDWNICCEISIKTNDNEQMNLEYWFIRSRTLNKELNLSKHLDKETSSRLFKSYNEMSILIKSIISLTRATPAYRISREGQSADSYIVCYRVYKCDSTFEQVFRNSRLKAHEFRNYSDEFRLGSVKTDHNVIDVSLVYRTNLRSNHDYKDKLNLDLSTQNNLIACNNLTDLNTLRNVQNDLNDQDKNSDLFLLKTDHFTGDDDDDELSERRKKEKSFLPAFAFNQPKEDDLPKFPDLPDEAFKHLLPANFDDDSLLIQSTNKKKDQNLTSTSKHSEPIKIPNSQSRKKTELDAETGNCKNSSPGCSSLGSFVIVDMKTPFAPNDQNDLGSFFNGPSPTFGENNHLADELEDITTQLAQMETNCQEWSSFIESLTSKEEDEEI